jgi:manganese/zinc/iron transport system permease protein
MTLVAVTAVASFEAVGSILVVAMLIVPAATAHLLTDRLLLMVVYSAGVGIGSSVLGYWAASVWNTNIAGMMTVAAGFLYGLAVFFSPRYGICSKVVQNVRMSLRVLREDLLAMLYRVEEIDATKQLSAAEATAAVDGGWLARFALRRMEQNGRILRHGDALQLTEQGRQAARQLVRTHRLWETYLVQQLGMPSDHVHEPAHRVEHFIDEHLRQEIESEVDTDGPDPHGREIPE